MSSVKNSQLLCCGVFSIIHEQTVRVSFVLQSKVEKNYMNLLSWADDNPPGAVLSVWVIIWVIWGVEAASQAT